MKFHIRKLNYNTYRYIYKKKYIVKVAIKKSNLIVVIMTHRVYLLYLFALNYCNIVETMFAVVSILTTYEYIYISIFIVWTNFKIQYTGMTVNLSELREPVWKVEAYSLFKFFNVIPKYHFECVGERCNINYNLYIITLEYFKN